MGTSPGALITCESLLPAPSPAGTARGVRSCCCTSQPCLSPPVVPRALWGGLWVVLGGRRCLPPAVSAGARSPQRSQSSAACLRGLWWFPEVPPLPAAFPTCFLLPCFPGKAEAGAETTWAPQRAERLCLQLARPDTTAQRAAWALGNAGRSQQRLLALPAHFWHACAVW